MTINTDKAIRLGRFWLPITRVMPAVAVALLAVSIVMGLSMQGGLLRLIPLTLAAALFALSVTAAVASAMKIRRADQDSYGDTDRAESTLASTVRWWRFSYDVCYRAMVTLMWLRHRQNRHAEARDVAGVILRFRHRRLPEAIQSAAYCEAYASLKLGDLAGVPGALALIRCGPMTLELSLKIDAMEIQYLVQSGQGQVALHDAERRTELTQLMPPDVAVKTLAWLALAARQAGDEALSRKLVRQVELLADVPKLVESQPRFAPLFLLDSVSTASSSI